MKRKTPMKRGPRRGWNSTLRPVNRKRAAMRKERDFAGPFADWVRTHNCAVFQADVWCEFRAYQKYGEPMRFCQAAHVRSRGAGGDAIGNLVPLCALHHQEQHDIGIKSFQAKYKVDLRAIAESLAEQWLFLESPSTTLLRRQLGAAVAEKVDREIVGRKRAKARRLAR